MAHLGLIGGIGPAATDHYYRTLVRKFALDGTVLDMTIVHADTPTLLKNVQEARPDDQVEIYLRLASRLASAGASCVAVTSIAGHFCVEAFIALSPLPVVNLISCVDKEVADRGYGRVGLIGTRAVMVSGFYGGLSSAQVVAPKGRLLDEVHAAYVDMATAGAAQVVHRSVFDQACKVLFDEEQVEAVLLAGTDLALVYAPATSPFNLIDCAEIHVDSLLDYVKDSRSAASSLPYV